MNSPQDIHVDHLRQLLDQRTTRAQLHGRFPSLSEFSDSPSVYSRPFFSPRQPEHNHPDHRMFDHPYRSPTASTFDMRSHQERLDDPGASMLDLDDDHRSSFASTDVYDDNDQGVPDGDDDDDDDEPFPRMSLLGPKMRFHSRAPWELEAEPLQEEDESDYTSPSRQQESFAKRTFGFGNASPRPGNSGRPSGESSRSQPRDKRSFETSSSQASNSRGVLYTLAQESLSATALGPSSSANTQSFRGQHRLNRGRPDSPDMLPPPSPNSSYRSTRSPRNTQPPSPRANHFTEQQSSFSHQINGFSQVTRHRQPSHHEDDTVHPYANPDLVASYTHDTPPSFSPRSRVDISSVPRSESTSTITVTETMSSISRSGTHLTLTPDTSASSVAQEHPLKPRNSSLQGKVISSPIPVHSNLVNEDSRAGKSGASLSSHPGLTTLPGWADRAIAPTFALISLEEARAQRTRSATGPGIDISDSASVNTTLPDQDHDAVSAVYSFDQSSSTSRARARSISTSSKARSAIQNMVSGKVERRDSEPAITPIGYGGGNGLPAKALKHKKSGFMRLFNASKEKEKEDRAAPPPVPALSEAYTAHNIQQNAPKPVKITSHRIPVPELTLPISDDSTTSPLSTKLSTSPKRTPPPLLINTQSSLPFSRGPVSAIVGSSHSRLLPPPPLSEQGRRPSETPQSAPPNVTEFPTLKLRPVSTMFSAHFAEHIGIPETQQSLDSEIDTPQSMSPLGAPSPLTPLYPRSEKERVSSINSSEDQSSIIRALQEQIVAAKMAWQRHIWELEGQVRDLKAEIEDIKAVGGNDQEWCDACGRGRKSKPPGSRSASSDSRSGMVNRPRARTGTSSRFGSGVS